MLYAAQELEKVKAKGEDQKAGVELVRRALEAPIRPVSYTHLTLPTNREV